MDSSASPAPPAAPPPPPATAAYAAPPAPQVVHHYHHPEKSGGTAALLEAIPGLFQVFGIGHMYAGNVGTGLLFMFGYWMVAFVNFLLCFIIIGFFTWPLCWVAMMIISPLTAANSCKSR
ncbi:hypothetical protein [Stenotrophomonas sp. SY1]|uniref:hypothetical protein n=1 Tax=Stenotrophomonas sp. SY1 TaxID=477235 RepID=UPI001E5E1EF9|nr:hypothetical protein [Stenotrophomonas sp. SY1]MCD9088341.1 hypothetical protein [Stenotrophomonas sp. SY1]